MHKIKNEKISTTNRLYLFSQHAPALLTLSFRKQIQAGLSQLDLYVILAVSFAISLIFLAGEGIRRTGEIVRKPSGASHHLPCKGGKSYPLAPSGTGDKEKILRHWGTK